MYIMSSLQKINLHSTLSKLLSRTLRVSGKDFKTRWISALSTFSLSPQLEFVQKIQPISWSVSKNYAKKSSNMRVTFKTENLLGDCPAELSENGEGKMGLVVIQEWWGMNQYILDKANEIGKEGGFVTIVPDLYRGKVAKDREEAGHLKSGLDWEGAVKDIRGAVLFLRKNGCSKVGATGFCMGGALTLAAAAMIPEVSAAAPFYGIPSADLCDVSQIKIPLQCHFGELDTVVGLSSPKDQDELKEKLNSGGVNYEFFSYKAGHAFANVTSPNFVKKCNDLAMQRLYEFMKANLSGID